MLRFSVHDIDAVSNSYKEIVFKFTVSFSHKFLGTRLDPYSLLKVPSYELLVENIVVRLPVVDQQCKERCLISLNHEVIVNPPTVVRFTVPFPSYKVVCIALYTYTGQRVNIIMFVE